MYQLEIKTLRCRLIAGISRGSAAAYPLVSGTNSHIKMQIGTEKDAYTKQALMLSFSSIGGVAYLEKVRGILRNGSKGRTRR
jgi:hypothetical protein